MWKVLPRCAREITSRRFRKQIIAWRKDYGSYGHSFYLNRDSRGFRGGERGRTARAVGRRIYSPNAGGEEAAVKRVVDGGPVPRAFWIGSAPASGANDRAFAITNLSAVHSLVPSA
jgi:hypothetical protein